MKIELFPIGREILTGRIHETNAGWIAGQITKIGGLVKKITVLDDNKTQICDEIKRAIDSGVDFIITCGGLGPTFDDITLDAIACAANAGLETNESALDFVKQKYAEYYSKGQVPHPDMTHERKKMAVLPAGSNWFSNDIGAAPGVFLEAGNTKIVALPGPPRELKPMYMEHVHPIIAKAIGKRAFAEANVFTDSTDESEISAINLMLMEEFEGVHAKSNPTFFGDETGIKITLSVWCESEKACEDTVDQARLWLKENLVKKNISVIDPSSRLRK